MIQDVKLKCTGCKACGDVCPKGAISYKENEEGFWYPVVDEEKCVKCGRCRDVCGAINHFCKEDGFARLVFAGWNRNDDIRRESTSGGIYHCFAKHVLDNGGYIVGSVYTDDFCSAYHTYTDSIEDLPRIMGSKYFQSDTEGIFAKTKQLLSGNRIVLFTGTPCQVYALKRYLGRPYENLITVDFICRGVPSPKLQGMKIRLYESQEGCKVTYYRDKSDKYAWSDFGELIRFENGKEKFISRWKDDINDCFIHKNLNIRESCYTCRLKDGQNASEITIGDFWGITGVTERDYKMGVSALIVNNQVGFDFISQLHETLYLEQRTVDEVRSGNPAYRNAPERPQERADFYDIVNTEGLRKAVDKYGKRSLKERVQIEKRIFKVKNRKWKPLFGKRKQINWCKFIYYNYFCKNVIRDKDAFIVPMYGTVIQLHKKSKVVLHGNLILNDYPVYKRAGRTSLFRVADGGTFIANNRIEIAFSNTISVGNNATCEMGYLFTGVGANIICNYSMKFGNHVMLGRDVCVFDSDYHDIYNQSGVRISANKAVVVEDCAWIGARSMVLKGSHIGRAAIVSANAMVMGDVESNRVFINKRESKSIGNNVFWKR